MKELEKKKKIIADKIRWRHRERDQEHLSNSLAFDALKKAKPETEKEEKRPYKQRMPLPRFSDLQIPEILRTGEAAIGVVKRKEVKARKDVDEDEDGLEYTIGVDGKSYSLMFKPNRKILPPEGFRMKWR